MKKLFAICFVLLAAFIHAVYVQAFMPRNLEPVLNNMDIYELKDRIFFFSANKSPDSRTVILPLRRWDIIFTGDHINQENGEYDLELVDHIIPGAFNHMMVYMGKDVNGLAYAVELTASSFQPSESLTLICIGSDFGIIRHPETSKIQDRDKITYRWAKRFVSKTYSKLILREEVLLQRIYLDLLNHFPYQLQASHSGKFWDTSIYLIDDGRVGGASCSDYWISLFEEYAGFCMKDVRISVEDLMNYFSNDNEGKMVYLPSQINPFPFRISIENLFKMGFHLVPPPAHIFPDGSEETGIVTPTLVMESPLLEEIPQIDLLWFLDVPRIKTRRQFPENIKRELPP